MSMLDINTIVSVYRGERGWCCCGCAGDHTYSSQHRAWLSKKRIHEIPDSEVDDRVVQEVVGKIEANKQHIVTINPIYVACEIGDELYIAYFAR